MKTDRPSPGYFYYTQKILFFSAWCVGSLPGKFVLQGTVRTACQFAKNRIQVLFFQALLEKWLVRYLWWRCDLPR